MSVIIATISAVSFQIVWNFVELLESLYFAQSIMTYFYASEDTCPVLDTIISNISSKMLSWK